jgi:hypothetical protein
MHRFLLLFFATFFTIKTQAFPCFITLVKDSCWTDYNVTVNIEGKGASKSRVSVTVLKGASWSRQQFDCQPAEELFLSATFTPVFWQADLGQIYLARRDFLLPKAIVKGDTAWNIPICYPADFSGVPLPPKVGGDCRCLMDTVPPVPPQPNKL